MLLHLFSLYFESWIFNDHPCRDFLGIWIGLRAMSGQDSQPAKLISKDYDWSFGRSRVILAVVSLPGFKA